MPRIQNEPNSRLLKFEEHACAGKKPVPVTESAYLQRGCVRKLGVMISEPIVTWARSVDHGRAASPDWVGGGRDAAAPGPSDSTTSRSSSPVWSSRLSETRSGEAAELIAEMVDSVGHQVTLLYDALRTFGRANADAHAIH